MPAAAAPWDEIEFVRLPPFERKEAELLLIHGIHERLKARKGGVQPAADTTAPEPASRPAAPVPKTSAPTPEEMMDIKQQYNDTITFLLDAVGCRPRRLLACLAKATPMTDAELQDKPPVMPGECRSVGLQLWEC